jgi:hypothetical protein
MDLYKAVHYIVLLLDSENNENKAWHMLWNVL